MKQEWFEPGCGATNTAVAGIADAGPRGHRPRLQLRTGNRRCDRPVNFVIRTRPCFSVSAWNVDCCESGPTRLCASGRDLSPQERTALWDGSKDLGLIFISVHLLDGWPAGAGAAAPGGTMLPCR